MPQILTLTMNPALDISTSVERLVPMHKLRCAAAQEHPGGGGINVARVLHRLGSDVCALFPSGGVTGEALCQLLQQEGVPFHAQPIAGDTRESFVVHENASQQEFRFVLPGPTLSEAEWQGSLSHIRHQSAGAQVLVVSGSLPPGVPDDFLVRLATLAAQQQLRLVLDSSGIPLARLMASTDVPGAWLIKPSLRELSELAGRPLDTEADQLAACRKLIESGRVQMVALSLGGDGAMLVTARQAWRAAALTVPVASTVGAGDSFLAGLLWSLSSQPAQTEQAFRYAMAAGAAALLTPGTALCQPADVERLVNQVQLQPC
ncbi:1-phosphofructokinase family hexose kinase [Aquabacterium sp.]|uniref:1-phosphofructokinase family hexose kinase n=1 Tax=Aquabacterium sp. TaxID=1872578 RepID=UPI0035B4B15C